MDRPKRKEGRKERETIVRREEGRKKTDSDNYERGVWLGQKGRRERKKWKTEERVEGRKKTDSNN